MNLLRLAPYGSDGTAAEPLAAVALGPTPFAPGFNVVAVINGKGLTVAPVFVIQTTDAEDPDDVEAVWTDLHETEGVLTDQYAAEITLPAGARWIRVDVETAAGAGDFDAYLLA